MNMQNTLEPAKKDSLGKTFVRGFVGGIGWVVGITIGTILLILLSVYVFSRLNLGKELEGYFQNFLTRTTEQQLIKQQEMMDDYLPDIGNLPGIQNLTPSDLNQLDKGVDSYPDNFQELLQENKHN